MPEYLRADSQGSKPIILKLVLDEELKYSHVAVPVHIDYHMLLDLRRYHESYIPWNNYQRDVSLEVDLNTGTLSEV